VEIWRKGSRLLEAPAPKITCIKRQRFPEPGSEYDIEEPVEGFGQPRHLRAGEIEGIRKSLFWCDCVRSNVALRVKKASKVRAGENRGRFVQVPVTPSGQCTFCGYMAMYYNPAAENGAKRQELTKALEESGGSKKQAARDLGISPKELRDQLRRCGLGDLIKTKGAKGHG
jgi:hypothetical protein